MLDNLDRKIRQMHQALTQLESSDISSVKPEEERTRTRYYCSVDFSGGKSDAELANVATLLVTNIACIKDHLKSWCESTGTVFEGDALIDSDVNVAIIHDLWNIDKHAKLNKPRSGRIPRISDLHQSLRLSTGKKPDSISPGDMYAHTGLRLSGSGSATLAISGNVVDENGKRLGEFSDICEKAVESWEKALLKAGVPMPSH